MKQPMPLTPITSITPITPRGFSLVEVIIVLGLIGILATLSLKLIRPTNNNEAWGRRAGDFIEHLQGMYRIHEARTGLSPVLDPLLCHTSYVAPLSINAVTCTNTTRADLHGLNAFLVANDESAQYGSVTISGQTVPYLDYPMGVRLWLKPELLSSNFKSMLDQVPFTESRDTYNNYHEFMVIDMDKQTTPTLLSNKDIIPIRYVESSGEIQTWYTVAQNSSSPPSI
jgi:prepilin-type N-terminal cleavage/methylation domain-containing protein